MIIDLLFTAGTVGFLLADLRQFHKLYKHSMPTNAISRSHLKLKIFSLVMVFAGYGLSSLHLSMCVSFAQLLLTVGILWYTLRRYEE